MTMLSSGRLRPPSKEIIVGNSKSCLELLTLQKHSTVNFLQLYGRIRQSVGGGGGGVSFVNLGY